MTPEEIWKEAAGGSQKAWTEVYRLFGGRLYQFFLRNTGRASQAMDMAQEVFERIWRHRQDFRTGRLQTWIFRIARNLLIDEWRRKGRSEVLVEEVPENADPESHVEATVIDRLEQDEAAKLIDETLTKLTEDDRLVIGLVYLGGLSFPELAEVMEIPLGTAKTRVRQARLRLESHMRDQMHGRSAGEAQ